MKKYENIKTVSLIQLKFKVLWIYFEHILRAYKILLRNQF